MTHRAFAWRRLGHVYAPSGRHGFDASHCHKPTPVLLTPDTIRVYFGVRDTRGVTRTTFVDVDAADPTRVRFVHDRPVLDVGKIGTFDDSGANVSSVCRHGDALFMYHIGWNPSTTVHTRNAIGVSVSHDGGTTFTRCFDGAVLDRTKTEPYYTGAVDVHADESGWRCWYTSGTEWVMVDGRPEIRYHIKYAESRDGFEWVRMNVSCIPPVTPEEATARPCVLRMDDGWHMWYSRRDIVAFRTDRTRGYRGGYATSPDGVVWTRHDHAFGLECAAEGWDSESIAYPYVLRVGNRLLMFYNGNGFGRTGFGVAECTSLEGHPA